MRKITAFSIVLILFLLASCGESPVMKKIGPVSYKVSSPEVTEVSDRKMDVIFRRDDRYIEGKILLPEGGGPHPVIVMSTGLYALYPEYERKARGFVEGGFAVLLFNYVSNEDANSDKIVKDQDLKGLMASQAEDLSAVIDSLPKIRGLDTSRVYLWGHSYGGMISAYVGCQRQDEIKGLILVEPSLDKAATELIPGDESTMVDICKDLEQCNLNTVIFVGSKSSAGEDTHTYDEAMEALRFGELITIDGADHLFAGEYGDKMVERSIKCIRSWE